MIITFSRLMKIFLLLVIGIQAYSQTETFDIISYTPPKDMAGTGWKKDAKDGVVNYVNVNQAAGTFCVITIYASSASSGNAQRDFTNEWKELVATPYSADPNPKTETQTTPEGWKAVVGAAPIKQDGLDVSVVLTVFSGFGKTLSVRTSFNDQSYTSQIDALLETIELDKTTGIPGNNSNPVTTVANVSAGRFGQMMYNAPAGWSEQIFADGIVFKPLDLPADEHLAIQIMQPLSSQGNLAQALEQSFAEATTMYNATSMYQAGGKYSKNEARKSFNGWEYIRGRGGVNANGTELGLEVFIVKINNRYERVAILESRKYCGGVSRYFASDRIQYRNSIEELLFSLRFSDFNVSPLKPGGTNGGGIIGLWQGTMQSTGAATGVRLEVFDPIFFSNGQVYCGAKFPTEGLDGLNSRIPAELYPRNWGTYTFNNGSGVIKLPFADIPIRIEGNKLILSKNQMDWPMYKINSVDGARFSGNYKMSESYGIIPTISFTASGQFSDNGAIRILSHEATTCINPGFRAGSGSYEVKNYTITFNYTDGRKVKIAFLGVGYDKNNPSPSTLRMSYSEDPLTRQ